MKMTIPSELEDILRLLAKRKTFMGYTPERVAEHIFRYGFNDITTTSFIQKVIEQQKLLEEKSDER